MFSCNCIKGGEQSRRRTLNSGMISTFFIRKTTFQGKPQRSPVPFKYNHLRDFQDINSGTHSVVDKLKLLRQEVVVVWLCVF